MFAETVRFIIKRFKNMSVTYNPKKRKRVKTHGFKVRMKTKDGRKVLKRRRQKGRRKLTV